MTIEEVGQTIKNNAPQYKDFSPTQVGVAFLQKNPQYNELLKNKPVADTFLKGHPILKGVSDVIGVTGLAKGLSQAVFLNLTPEGKETKKLFDSGKMTLDQFENIVGGLASPQEVIGGSIGAATSILGGGISPKTVIGRLAQGTAIGAGAGLAQGLQKPETTTGEVLESTAIGAGTGLAVSGVLEGVGKLFKLIGQSKKIQQRTGFTYNKELQPPLKEVSKDIENGFKTFGEQVANVTDDAGKPVYIGNYKTLLNKSKSQLNEKGKSLLTKLVEWDKANPQTFITRKEVTAGIKKTMQDTYGALTPQQSKQIAFEVSRMPNIMSLEKLENVKRMYDNLIPDNFWSKLDDPALSFPSLIRYSLRDKARELINQKTSDGIIQGLNNSMSIAMDVKKLAANQIAKRALAKISEAGGTATTRFPFSYYISKFFDDILFNPALTTRTSQAIRGLGSKIGQTPLRQFGRTAITEAITKNQTKSKANLETP